VNTPYNGNILDPSVAKTSTSVSRSNPIYEKFRRPYNFLAKREGFKDSNVEIKARIGF
jgi:hypothetical protein